MVYIMEEYLKKRTELVKRNIPIKTYSDRLGTAYGASIYLLDTYLFNKSFDSARK